MLILLFRSDTRTPEIIFPNGFSTRMVPEEKITPLGPFESDKNRTIALGSELEATPFFPVRSNEAQTWVYLVVVDDNQDEKQYLDLHSMSLDSEAKSSAFELPFSEFPKEKNVIRILPENVLCAFPIERILKEINIGNAKAVYCNSFKIKGPAVKNPAANDTFKQDFRMQRKLAEVIQKYNAKVGVEIDVTRPTPKNAAKLKVAKARNAFFVMKKFDNFSEFKQSTFKTTMDDLKLNPAFFQAAKLQNSSGILFSSKKQLCKQHSLFHAAIEHGMFDTNIGFEEKQIEEFRLMAKQEFTKGHSFDEIQAAQEIFKAVYGEEIPELDGTSTPIKSI